MPIYQYTARTEDGQLIREVMVYRDEPGLRQHLRRKSLYVLDVVERRTRRFSLRSRIRLGDLIIMCRQLRTMVNAGMPLLTGLEALAEQSTNPALKDVLKEVARSVGSGRTLANSLADYPHIFPELLILLVRSGEEGGRLPEALREASRQLELQMEIRQKLISALIYPAVTLFATAGTLTAMMLWIVPMFKQIYKDLHATLPAVTLTLVAISDLLVQRGWIVILAIIASVVALRRYNRTPEGRDRIDGMKLKAPVLGALFSKSAAANLTGCLAGLLESGVPLIQALDTSARVCGNTVMGAAARNAAERVTTGSRLSDELELSGQFPLMVVRMVGIAEDAGNMPEVLRQISASYIEDVEYTIRRIMTMIEPIMVLCVGGVVGFVLVALYYPIFNLGNAFVAGA